ncbi:hypothetical protein [Konateibacter massiliensis]|uniref:hypothetical protein n=1 Tax=Konateibacter massiliensis TaxID=2002841 RepID=UPI00117B0982|nr:hypothetical protein [Konateibacter massiliensis]
MKKINSIGYGGRILSFAAFFTFLLPGIISLVMLVYKNAMLVIWAKVSFGFGITIIFFFSVLLAIEFHQDKKQNLYYETQKNVKLTLEDGLYECQSCGNRAVKAEDKNCSICGILFQNSGK